jgi:hypothetical protein
MKGESLHLLPKTFPDYQFVILDALLNKELRNNASNRKYLDNFFQFFPDAITEVHSHLLKYRNINQENCFYNPTLL